MEYRKRRKMSGKIERKSMGQSSYLGFLYDARNEKVLSMSIFNQELPVSLIKFQETNNTYYEYDFNDSNEEKFSKLNVEAELKCDILSGLITLKGSGISFFS